MTKEQEDRIISKCKQTDRTGLYIMVILMFLQSCADNNLSKDDVDLILKEHGLIKQVVPNEYFNSFYDSMNDVERWI